MLGSGGTTLDVWLNAINVEVAPSNVPTAIPMATLTRRGLGSPVVYADLLGVGS